MRHMIGLFLVLGFLPSAPVAAAQSAAQLEQGQKIYTAQKCGVCHAVAGKGNAKGALDTVGSKLSADEIRQWIVDAPGMTAKTKAARKPRRLAGHLGRPPGAVLLRSDVARKRRFGVEPTVRLQGQAYDPAVSIIVYDELTRSACEVARAGYVAIVDAVFATDAQRKNIGEAASREALPFVGLWLDAPVKTMEARLATRRADASDATIEVLHEQQKHLSIPTDWARIDASATPDRVVDAALILAGGLARARPA